MDITSITEWLEKKGWNLLDPILEDADGKNIYLKDVLNEFNKESNLVEPLSYVAVMKRRTPIDTEDTVTKILQSGLTLNELLKWREENNKGCICGDLIITEAT